MNSFSNVFGGVFASEMTKALTGIIFVVFVVIVLGYMLGRINIKGVALGSSGVFIVALAVGVLIAEFGDKIGFDWLQETKVVKGSEVSYAYMNENIIAAVKNLGLGMFVAGIGFIAGPTFIRNFKKKAWSFLGIGITIIVTGTVICIILIKIGAMEPYQGAGLLMGALSSTPGQAAAQSVFNDHSKDVVALSGLAYPFGVLGVVLFVQFLPKILRADMDKEVQKLKDGVSKSKTKANADGDFVEPAKASEPAKADADQAPQKKLIVFDSLGLCIFGVAVALGIIIGAITIPLGSGIKFALGTTGGALLVGLLFAHFGRVGRISLEVPKTTLSVMRELGLIFFLAGSGIEGGFKFLSQFEVQFLFYGMLMTLVPMIVGFFVARYAFKLELLNNLGSICGGMTSTPALGALVHVSKTDDVAQSYAATYPIALILLVFVPQIIQLI